MKMNLLTFLSISFLMMMAFGDDISGNNANEPISTPPNFYSGDDSTLFREDENGSSILKASSSKVPPATTKSQETMQGSDNAGNTQQEPVSELIEKISGEDSQEQAPHENPQSEPNEGAPKENQIPSQQGEAQSNENESGDVADSELNQGLPQETQPSELNEGDLKRDQTSLNQGETQSDENKPLGDQQSSSNEGDLKENQQTELNQGEIQSDENKPLGTQQSESKEGDLKENQTSNQQGKKDEDFLSEGLDNIGDNKGKGNTELFDNTNDAQSVEKTGPSTLETKDENFPDGGHDDDSGIIGKLIIGLIIFGLLAFGGCVWNYRHQMEKYKIAPFNPPKFCPQWIFPRVDTARNKKKNYVYEEVEAEDYRL